MEARVLITGARGFIGHHIVKELLNQNANILTCDRTKADFNNEKVICKQVDILNRENLFRCIADFQPTSVIHLAAIASPVYGNIAELYDINVRGTENLLSGLKSGTRVVLTSTAGVYGNSEKRLITEDTPYNPQNHYSLSKMVMEYIAKTYQDELDIKIIRPFNIIGHGQKENFLVPKLINAFTTKQPILSVGNIDTYRDFVDVDFASKVFCKVAITSDMPENILNICTGLGTKGRDILNILTELTGYSPNLQVNPTFLRKNEIMRLVGDPTKCNAFIGSDVKSKSVKEILTDLLIK